MTSPSQIVRNETRELFEGDETMKRAYVEIRSQHSRGGSNGFGGPDTYVAVQVVPEGVEKLKCLNLEAAERRGIEIIHCGEGYSKHQATSRSMLRQAIARAESTAHEINNGEDTKQLSNPNHKGESDDDNKHRR